MAIKTFKDYPNIETPLNAENLNEITTTILKIFGADVDTYDTGKNYVVDDFVVYQKELWRCINETTGTWTEEKWVKDSIIVPSENMQINNKLMNNSRNEITAWPTSTTVINNAGVKIPLTAYNGVGELLTLLDGGIKIGVGVSKIKISAQVTWSSNTDNSKGVLIYKNNTDNIVCRNIFNTSTQIQNSLVTAPRIINVVKDDIIYLYATDGTGSANIAGTYLTYLTIEVVK